MKVIADGGSIFNPAGAACLIGVANVVEDNDNFLESSKEDLCPLYMLFCRRCFRGILPREVLLPRASVRKRDPSAVSAELFSVESRPRRRILQH